MKTEGKYLYNENNEPIISTTKTPVDLLFLVIESVSFDQNKATQEEFFKLDVCALYSENRLVDFIERVNKANEEAITNDVINFKYSLYRISQQTFNFKKATKLI